MFDCVCHTDSSTESSRAAAPGGREGRSLEQLYDEVRDLQEELYSDMATDDIFSFDNRETLDLFTALVMSHTVLAI